MLFLAFSLAAMIPLSCSGRPQAGGQEPLASGRPATNTTHTKPADAAGSNAPPLEMKSATPAETQAGGKPETDRPGSPPPPGVKRPVTKQAGTVPRIAESLGGHDRHLVYRPFGTVAATDFELGPLADGTMDAALATSLDALEKGILAGTIPDELFADEAARVASIFLAETFTAMPKPTSVRFSAPRTQPGGTVAVGVRVIVADETGARAGVVRSALGLAILAPPDQGRMHIVHLELDLPALLETSRRTGVWDPYSIRQER
jgi:hypothetical protein